MARTPSAQAHNKMLEASLSLFAERGIDTTSMDAISEASGVSKATIYKHWQDKDALALEALGMLFGMNDEPPKFDSGDLRQDFVDVLNYQPTQPRQEMKNRVMPHVMAYAARNRAFGDTWRSRILTRPQTQLKMLMDRGITQKKLVKNINVDIALAQLLGPALYWYIFHDRKAGNKLPLEWSEQVVDTFWKVYGRTK
ncbi:MAG TPA: TetR/AcrR family transcriptional regulator [Terriglobales bacterium]|nr:TetR/AcrR family transcriptional regulator [Terriglobales bacterium]